MATEKTLPSVQDHARTLIDQAIADGKLPKPDSAEVPSFTQGKTTEPPAVPGFSAGQVAIPEGQQPQDGSLQAPQAMQAAQAAASAPPQPGAEPVQAQAGTQAAEAAAAQVADAFADFDEIEVEEPDFPDIKIPVRVPKQYAQIMKRAFPRRADYDRTRARWGEAAPVIEPLLQDGRIRQILPLIQRALTDQAYGDYVAKGYERALSGRPLIEQAAREAAALGAPQTTTPTPSIEDLGITDPYIAEQVRPLLTQYEQRLQQYEQRFQTAEQREAAERDRQAAAMRDNIERANKMQGAHEDLARAFPGVFKTELGPNDPAWVRALQTTKDYGYADVYDLRAAIVFGGQQWQNLEAERLAATASPAAQAIQQMDQRQIELARQQASQLAQPAGGGATAQTVPTPPPPPPSTRNPDGSMKPPDQFMRENYQWLVATGRVRAS